MAGKLKFAQNLYLGEGIAPEKLDKLKKRLNKKPLLANVYLITPARNPADQLDIFDARQLVQPHYKDEEFLVLGMASGYEDALQLIERISGECLKARGDCWVLCCLVSKYRFLSCAYCNGRTSTFDANRN